MSLYYRRFLAFVAPKRGGAHQAMLEKPIEILCLIGILLFCVMYSRLYWLRIQQIKADAECRDARMTKEIAQMWKDAERAAEKGRKMMLNTPLERVLYHVPLLTADQINENELIRLTTMQGFRD